MSDKFLFNLIGGLFIAIGLLVLVVHYYRLKKWIPTIGTVIEIHEKQSCDDGHTTTLYSGTLAYRLPDQSEVLEFRDDMWQSPCPYVVGEEVPILVNPEKPKQACVKHGNARTIVSVVMIGLGALAIILASKK